MSELAGDQVMLRRARELGDQTHAVMEKAHVGKPNERRELAVCHEYGATRGAGELPGVKCHTSSRPRFVCVALFGVFVLFNRNIT